MITRGIVVYTGVRYRVKRLKFIKSSSRVPNRAWFPDRPPGTRIYVYTFCCLRALENVFCVACPFSTLITRKNFCCCISLPASPSHHLRCLCLFSGNRSSSPLLRYGDVSTYLGRAPLPSASERCRLRGKEPRRNLFESFMSVYLECFCLPRGYCGSQRWFTLQYLRKRSNYCPREAPKAPRDRSSPGFQLASAAEGGRLMAAEESSSSLNRG